MLSEPPGGSASLQVYILAAISLVGILTNTGLFLHLSARVGHRLGLMHADMKDLNKTMTALRIDVALLKDKAGM
jgi:hypothetical protein